MYYWGLPDASVEFCEDKYVVTSWIGEYYNTLSSLCYILVAVFFLSTKVKKIAWSVIGIGVGSMLLHGTLRYYGQWLDELSMLITSFNSLYYIRPNIKEIFFVKEILLPLIIITYFIFHNVFIIFFICFSLLNLTLLYLTAKDSSVLGKLYILSFGGGFMCWTLDKFGCIFFKDYYFHAWWHVLSSIGILFALLELLYNPPKLKDA